MKERPLLCSSPIVRALLNTRVGDVPAAINPALPFKDQTRRPVKRIPMLGEPSAWCAAAAAQEPGWVSIVGDYRRFCPYGQVGDRLWVRETFQLLEWFQDHWEPAVLGGQNAQSIDKFYQADCVLPDQEELVWRPSIFMPRWASRITLEITDVRVDRLQDITPEDAEREGLVSDEFPIGGDYVRKWGVVGWQHQWFRQSPVDAFERLWDSIYRKRNKVSGLDHGHPWYSNPWVWVINFRRVK